MLIIYLLTANNVEIAACSVSCGVEHETKAFKRRKHVGRCGFLDIGNIMQIE